jgi:hypothetical protein
MPCAAVVSRRPSAAPPVAFADDSASTGACHATVAACGLDRLARDFYRHSCDLDELVLPHGMRYVSL